MNISNQNNYKTCKFTAQEPQIQYVCLKDFWYAKINLSQKYILCDLCVKTLSTHLIPVYAFAVAPKSCYYIMRLWL